MEDDDINFHCANRGLRLCQRCARLFQYYTHVQLGFVPRLCAQWNINQNVDLCSERSECIIA